MYPNIIFLPCACCKKKLSLLGKGESDLRGKRKRAICLHAVRNSLHIHIPAEKKNTIYSLLFFVAHLEILILSFNYKFHVYIELRKYYFSSKLLKCKHILKQARCVFVFLLLSSLTSSPFYAP